MARTQARDDTANGEAVAAYKRVLAEVIARRPSGTRQRLAAALMKNRSFISHITSPNYATPIPANHIEIIFEVCHFSAAEKRQFMEAYGAAHAKRLALVHDSHRLKAHTIYLPDLGDDGRNARLHALVTDFVRQVARLVEDEPRKEKQK
jgi:hypothetical protein